MSESKRGEKNHLFGKTISLKVREKISKSQGTTIFMYSLYNQLINSFIYSRAAAKHFSCEKKYNF